MPIKNIVPVLSALLVFAGALFVFKDSILDMVVSSPHEQKTQVVKEKSYDMSKTRVSPLKGYKNVPTKKSKTKLNEEQRIQLTAAFFEKHWDVLNDSDRYYLDIFEKQTARAGETDYIAEVRLIDREGQIDFNVTDFVVWSALHPEILSLQAPAVFMPHGAASSTEFIKATLSYQGLIFEATETFGINALKHTTGYTIAHDFKREAALLPLFPTPASGASTSDVIQVGDISGVLIYTGHTRRKLHYDVSTTTPLVGTYSFSRHGMPDSNLGRFYADKEKYPEVGSLSFLNNNEATTELGRYTDALPAQVIITDLQKFYCECDGGGRQATFVSGEILDYKNNQALEMRLENNYHIIVGPLTLEGSYSVDSESIPGFSPSKNNLGLDQTILFNNNDMVEIELGTSTEKVDAVVTLSELAIPLFFRSGDTIARPSATFVSGSIVSQ